MNIKTVASYHFGGLTVYEKTFVKNNVEWRYTISGNGKKIAIDFVKFCGAFIVDTVCGRTDENIPGNCAVGSAGSTVFRNGGRSQNYSGY